MPKNKIDDLRNHLFETIEMLKDGSMDIETAKGVAHIAQVIVSVTKLEVDFVKNVAGLGTGFIPPSRFGTGFIPVSEEDKERLRDQEF